MSSSVQHLRWKKSSSIHPADPHEDKRLNVFPLKQRGSLDAFVNDISLIAGQRPCGMLGLRVIFCAVMETGQNEREDHGSLFLCSPQV